MGLGRSLFGILDQRLIAHGLEKLREGLEQGARPVAHFVTAHATQLLRARINNLRRTSSPERSSRGSGSV
ncbi:hypothetical protein D3C72_2234280 [compost metagenome]